jgi:hypothetical protein
MGGTLTNTIVSLNVGGDISDCRYSGTNNLVGDDDIGLLGPLGYYGGPTQTLALLPGTEAIAAGIPVRGVTTDQRGFPLDTPHPDIGAFQVQSINPYLLEVNTTSDNLSSPPHTLSLRQAVNLASVLKLTGSPTTITFDPTVFAKAQTITLTAGQLELSNTGGTMTITGPAAEVTVNGNNASRVFLVDPNVKAVISALTIRGARRQTVAACSIELGRA